METPTNEAFARVQTARHPERPYTMDLLKNVFENFIELHGDRRYADDEALIGGFAQLDGIEICVIGQQKGRDTNQRRRRNFGMPKPEGYRKALRLMKLAEKFRRPVVTFIDTPGAYPGIDAEERGQAEAIAFNLREMASLKVPVIVVVLGEGGSGGALAIGVGDVVLMLENSVYSVISPEGCAAILWKDAAKSDRAAECLRLTARDLRDFGLIDEIVAEQSAWKMTPENGKSDDEAAQTGNFKAIAENLKEIIRRHLLRLSNLSEAERTVARYEKFRRMGRWDGAR